MAWDTNSPGNIKQFQKAYGLKADGLAGPKTTTAFGTNRGINIAKGLAGSPTGAVQVAQPVSVAPQVNSVNPHVTPRDEWGNWQEGLAGSQYGYVDPTTGVRGTVMLNPEQMDAVNNPMGGNEPSTDWAGGLDTAMKGAGAAAGLANAYLGYKNYKMAKDMFGFEKAAANRNIANQASEYNTGLQNAGEVGMSLAGNTMDPNARAARQAQLDAQKISGAPIG